MGNRKKGYEKSEERENQKPETETGKWDFVLKEDLPRGNTKGSGSKEKY